MTADSVTGCTCLDETARGCPVHVVEHAAPKVSVSPEHAARTREYFERLIGPLREVARENGYALAVHGSLVRDIDLIAVPWKEHVSHPACLAEAIQKKAAEVIGNAWMHPAERERFWFVAGCPGMKSHGRLCWTFHLGGGPYIDLSVVPPKGSNWA